MTQLVKEEAGIALVFGGPCVEAHRGGKGVAFGVLFELYDLSVEAFEATDLYPPATPEEVAAVATLSAVLAACDTQTVTKP